MKAIQKQSTSCLAGQRSLTDVVRCVFAGNTSSCRMNWAAVVSKTWQWVAMRSTAMVAEEAPGLIRFELIQEAKRRERKTSRLATPEFRRPVTACKVTSGGRRLIPPGHVRCSYSCVQPCLLYPLHETPAGRKTRDKSEHRFEISDRTAFSTRQTSLNLVRVSGSASCSFGRA